MKFFEFIKKYQLILFLFFLVVVLFFLKIFYGNDKSNQNNVLPTITPTPEIIQKKPKTFDPDVLNEGNPEYPLKNFLPYSTDSFKIIGYDDPYTLVIRIKSGNKIETEKEIKEWIENYIPEDTEHKIIFTD